MSSNVQICFYDEEGTLILAAENIMDLLNQLGKSVDEYPKMKRLVNYAVSKKTTMFIFERRCQVKKVRLK